MKLCKSILVKTLIVVALAMPWAAAQALERFNLSGVITDVNSASLSLYRKGQFRFAPGMQVIVDGKAGGKLSSFKRGASASVRGHVLNGVRYAERIVYHPIENE